MDTILGNISSLYRGPGGAVAVLRDGVVQAHRVWGMADMDRRIPITPRTRMPICSISKQMLCLVIADLSRKPTALMKDSGGDVWEQFTNELPKMLPHLYSDGSCELTVAHLYNMQSGLRDYWASTLLWGAKPEEPFSIAEDAPRTLERTKSFHFQPGTEFSYCNVNFHVLARLVETISGQSLEQLLAERVFIPAGMSTAALTPNTAGPPLPIVGYEGDEKHGYFPATNRIEWSGDAGITASLEDMIAYEKYLDRSWDDAESGYHCISQKQTYKDGSPAAYGFGLFQIDIAGKNTLGHGGALRGFRLHRLHVPSERISIVVMFNHEANAASAAEEILKQVLKEDTKASTIAPPPATEWKGNFLDPRTQMLIKVEVNAAGELFIDVAGGLEKMTLTDAKRAERPNMTASIHGDTLHLCRTRDNRKYSARRIYNHVESGSNSLPSKDKLMVPNGDYHSSELESTFHCTGDGHNMYGSFDGFLGKGPAHLMRYVGKDIWLLACPRGMDAPAPGDWTCVFRRGHHGDVEGVTVGCWLARRVDYAKKTA